MSKQNVLRAICAFVLGWLLFPLFVPFALSAALLAGILIVVVVALRLLDNKDWMWVVGGIAVGVVLSILVPSLRLDTIAGYSLIWSALFGVMFSFQV